LNGSNKPSNGRKARFSGSSIHSPPLLNQRRQGWQAMRQI
jgi:hypothetical protein